MSQSVIEVGAVDLIGATSIVCPNPQMKIWNTHPRIFLDVVSTGKAKCPYCGAEYKLKEGESLHAH